MLYHFLLNLLRDMVGGLLEGMNSSPCPSSFNSLCSSFSSYWPSSSWDPSTEYQMKEAVHLSPHTQGWGYDKRMYRDIGRDIEP